MYDGRNNNPIFTYGQDKSEWLGLSKEEKNEKLFLKQKNLLDTFLQHGAISKAQYNKSLTDMGKKMGMAQK